MVRILVAPVDEGVTDGGLNDAQVIPEGRGVIHDSVTDWAAPAFNVAVIVTVPELPC